MLPAILIMMFFTYHCWNTTTRKEWIYENTTKCTKYTKYTRYMRYRRYTKYMKKV